MFGLWLVVFLIENSVNTLVFFENCSLSDDLFDSNCLFVSQFFFSLSSERFIFFILTTGFLVSLKLSFYQVSFVNVWFEEEGFFLIKYYFLNYLFLFLLYVTYISTKFFFYKINVIIIIIIISETYYILIKFRKISKNNLFYLNKSFLSRNLK